MQFPRVGGARPKDFFAVADRHEEGVRDPHSARRPRRRWPSTCTSTIFICLRQRIVVHFSGRQIRPNPGGFVTSFENDAHRRWVNREAPGDEVVLTYRAPLGLTEDRVLHVRGGVLHETFVSMNPAVCGAARRFRSCQVNVHCPVETVGNAVSVVRANHAGQFCVIVLRGDGEQHLT